MTGTSARQRRVAALALGCILLGIVGARTEATEEHLAFKDAKAPESQLVVTKTVTLPNGTEVTRAKQRVDGLDVLGAEAIFVDTPDGSERVYSDSTRGNVRPNAPDAKVTRPEAIDIALDANDVEELRDSVSASRALTQAEGGTLVWKVLVPSAEPLGDFESLVDATTGEVLTNSDLLAYSTGVAKIFDPNAVVRKNVKPTTLIDSDDADSAELSSLRTLVSLPRIASGQFCLKGKYVEALLGTSDDEVCRPDLNWKSVKRNAEEFEALMAYFHIDRAQNYIKSLGFTGDTAVNKRVQKVHVNAITQDNSFYSTITKDLTLGTGGVDDGEDADVILHEYGHSIQADQVPNYGTQPEGRALGEGFGDYLAAALSAQLSKPADPEWNVCIFDWDGVSWGSGSPLCGRRADIAETTLAAHKSACPGSGLDEIHCVGKIWSTSLYKLRKALGKDAEGKRVMDRVVLTSHFLELADVDFEDAGFAVLDADEALYPSGTADDGKGQHYNQINDEFVAREFIPQIDF